MRAHLLAPGTFPDRSAHRHRSARSQPVPVLFASRYTGKSNRRRAACAMPPSRSRGADSVSEEQTVHRHQALPATRSPANADLRTWLRQIPADSGPDQGLRCERLACRFSRARPRSEKCVHVRGEGSRSGMARCVRGRRPRLHSSERPCWRSAERQCAALRIESCNETLRSSCASNGGSRVAN